MHSSEVWPDKAKFRQLLKHLYREIFIAKLLTVTTVAPAATARKSELDVLISSRIPSRLGASDEGIYVKVVGIHATSPCYCCLGLVLWQVSSI